MICSQNLPFLITHSCCTFECQCATWRRHQWLRGKRHLCAWAVSVSPPGRKWWQTRRHQFPLSVVESHAFFPGGLWTQVQDCRAALLQLPGVRWTNILISALSSPCSSAPNFNLQQIFTRAVWTLISALVNSLLFHVPKGEKWCFLSSQEYFRQDVLVAPTQDLRMNKQAGDTDKDETGEESANNMNGAIEEQTEEWKSTKEKRKDKKRAPNK